MPLDRVDVVGVLLLVVVVLFTAIWQTVTTFSHEVIEIGGTTIMVLLFGAVLAALIRRRSSAASYVVTNYRLLVQTADRIDGIPLSQLDTPMVFAETRDGVGNISFGPPQRLKQVLAALIHGADAPNRHMHLLQIENAREVVGVLRNVIRPWA
jgi:hypothetical protein